MSTSNLVSQISEAVEAAIAEETSELRESLADVRAMMDYEDRGWQAIFGLAAGDKTEGLNLEEVKMISEKARTKVAAGALEKRASDLHGSYVFGNGQSIEGTRRDPNAAGRPLGIVKFFEDPINQENLFSESAKKELQRARFTDGNVIAFCDKKTKKVRRIPVYEIEGVITNPDYPDEVTAWLRSWTHHLPDGKTEQRRAWAYTNRHTGVKQMSIQVGNESIPVLPEVIAVDLRANRQVGWVWGVPDVTAGMHWTAAYGEILRYGQIVNESLAKIVHKVITKTQKTANTVGVKMRGTGAGGTAALGEGQDIQLVNSSQRSFDFTAGSPIAAMAASAWNVTTQDLLNNSATSGASYGSLVALGAGNVQAMKGLQQDWTAFYQDIFEVMGFGRPEIQWAPLEKPDLYREMQVAALAWNTGLVHPEEARPRILTIADMMSAESDAPEGVLIPNNENSWARGDIDPKDDPAKPDSGTTTSATSPDQGRASGTGGMDSGAKNDERTDLIGESLNRMANEAMLERWEAIAARLEAVQRD